MEEGLLENVESGSLFYYYIPVKDNSGVEAEENLATTRMMTNYPRRSKPLWEKAIKGTDKN
jgi:hypothetical protein